MPDVKCYACEREPVQQCPRCGRPYCEDHGEDFCDVCLEPASGVPSFTLYRGSLLALLVGAALAVWLIVQPSSDGESALRPIIVTPTSPAASGNLTTAVPGAGTVQPATTPGTPRPGTTPPAGATTAAVTATRPATGGTPVAGTTPGATTTGDYIVVSGDTLSGICSDKIRRPPSLSVTDCVAQIRTLNSLTSDNLEIGQKLRVPQ